MKDFEKMTNKELAAYCEAHGIKVTDAKNPSKPNNTEFRNAIMASTYEATQNEVDDEGVDYLEDESDLAEFLDISENEPAPMPEKVKKPSRSELRKKQYNELMPFRRVIITENDKNQTGLENQVHFCTWGNRLIGHHTDRFICGSPWHVRQGALNNLENMRVARSVQDEEGNTIRHETVPKYIIQHLDPLTEEERAVIAKRQLIRDSSIDSLI